MEEEFEIDNDNVNIQNTEYKDGKLLKKLKLAGTKLVHQKKLQKKKQKLTIH